MEATERQARVLQVNVSNGGVPKLPVEKAWVGRFGLAGDGHREQTVHGGPHRAVCLFAIEAIERLQSEGHPIEPGSAGENLTTTGVEWSLLPVGTRARIGHELEIELASSTTPCSTQKHNFRDGRFSRISIDLHPSDSRMYARVVHEGEVRPGDPITVSQPAPDSRAGDEQLLGRLDRAEIKSALAAWRAAADAGFEVDIREDGELAMCAARDIPGPAFNHASGLARLPNLLHVATAFYDQHRLPGWLVTENPPWPKAQPTLTLNILAGDPQAIGDTALPAGASLRAATPTDGPAVESVYAASSSTGLNPVSSNPWPAVYTRLADHPHRVLLVVEQDERIVAVGSLHVHNRTGWLRGAAVVPEARGQGLQRTLVSARAAIARERGCDLVGSAAEPSGPSTANLERMGLRVVGQRSHYLYVPPGVTAPA